MHWQKRWLLVERQLLLRQRQIHHQKPIIPGCRKGMLLPGFNDGHGFPRSHLPRHMVDLHIQRPRHR